MNSRATIVMLTPSQRLLVYRALLKKVCKDPRVSQGMCWYLRNLLDKDPRMGDDWKHWSSLSRMYHLPELLKYGKGKFFTSYWAPRTSKGWEKRIGWIEKAISEVESQM